MPRPTCRRQIGFLPKTVFFKPAGVPVGVLQEVVIGQDEVEAMRLKDVLGFPQEEAANQMGVSQPTFHRLINAAHQKIADAIVYGKALRIEGGNVSVRGGTVGPCRWRKQWGEGCPALGELEGGVQKGSENEEGGVAMKIAVTSSDGMVDGMVDERFGRAKKIILFDTTDGSHSVIDNTPNMNAPQGAGIQTSQNIVNAGAQAVISGHLGPNAFRVLRVAGIPAYTATNMSVKEAMERYREEKLSKLEGADVEGHW
jgi:predicted DNA-binding protein (UPF0251 family)/predicted Fe-Mo cluster-binding NifX family protein